MKPKPAASPFKWPFPPPPPKVQGRNPAHAARAPARTRASRPSPLTRKAMLADVVLVIFWGASIPGLMWLGAAGGF
jgi:hypothetical protein